MLRGWRLARGIVSNARRVAQEIAARRPDAVLSHFSEYLAPLWAWRMRQLRKSGISFHAVLHDPVRNHVVGPAWWHARSVREAFSFLDTAFVHTQEPVDVPPPAAVVSLPYGIHSFPRPSRSREEVRRSLDIPQGSTVLTSFGYIRDNKNLDLVIRAISTLPNIFLVVAGSEQEGGHRPAAYYERLARELGCASRCRWLIRFTTAEETADLMNASDVSLLVYARSFVSSSAAMGVAANYRLPSLVSSGSQTMKAIVLRYRLGVWVEPDSESAIRQALAQWDSDALQPDWEGYARDHSWRRNAELVQHRIREVRGTEHDAARCIA